MTPHELLTLLHTAEKLKDTTPPLRHLRRAKGERGRTQLASGADGLLPPQRISPFGHG